jgi:hypothetical protein
VNGPGTAYRLSRLPSLMRRKTTTTSLVGRAFLVGFLLFGIGCNQRAVPAREPISQKRNWDIPASGRERELYDLAHSLALPPAVAKPVPFDFEAASKAFHGGGHTVEQQYFEHLCKTESRDYYFNPRNDVAGFEVMRPRLEMRGTPADSDRYGPEEPVGFGWLADDDQILVPPGGLDLLADNYVQPLYGVYEFVEFADPTRSYQLVRIERDANNPRNKDAPMGLMAGWRAPSGPLRVPYVQGRRDVAEHLSRFGLTHRGLRRPRDRALGIAGADFIIYDLATKEVIALRRTFASTFVPRRPDFTKWSAARRCSQKKSTPIPIFVMRALRPRLGVNDAYLPSAELENYHNYLESLMEPPRD